MTLPVKRQPSDTNIWNPFDEISRIHGTDIKLFTDPLRNLSILNYSGF